MKFSIIIGFVFLLLQGCSVYKEVEVKEVLDVKILEFTNEGADCEVFVTVYNPNGYKITLTDSYVDLFFEGKPLGHVQLTDNIVIPKLSQTTVKMKCIADSENLQAILGNVLALLFKTEFVLEGKGYIKGKAMFISKKVPIDFSEKLSKKDIGF
jgi:LEA14-like dessication related protein